MGFRRIPLLALSAVGSLAAVAGQAGTIPTATFDWNPRPLGLNGSKFTADTVKNSMPIDRDQKDWSISVAGPAPSLPAILLGKGAPHRIMRPLTLLEECRQAAESNFA
jgi:hypothetical protein